MNQLTADLISENYSSDTTDFKNGLKFHSVTSTPKAENGSRDRGNSSQIKHKKMNVDESEAKQFLLESRDVWPLAFTEACQEYLNKINSNIKKDILIQESEPRQSRWIKSQKTKRRSGRNRSISPGGAQKMKNDKWDKYSEIAVELIDSVILRFKDLLGKDLCSSDYGKEAKDVIEKLLKQSNHQSLVNIIKQIQAPILLEVLKLLLTKLGVLIPIVFSEQFIQFKALLDKDGNNIIVMKENIAAVQTMLFNISLSSRNVLRKVLSLFSMLSKEKNPTLSKGRLSHLLRPSLFEGEGNKNQLKLCCDFITLSDRLFCAPSDLVDQVKDKINSRINKGMFMASLELAEKPTKDIKVTPRKHRCSSITLESFKKLDSPKSNNMEEPKKATTKRKSVAEVAIGACQRAVSSILHQKDSYNIDLYYTQMKKSKAGDLYSV